MKYQFRNSIEDLYHFSTQTKDVAKCKNLDDFIKLASSFGDNDIQGKVFGENFYDFLFLEAGSTFDVAGVRPATEDQDVKENIDAFLKHGRKWLPAQYKFMADKFAPLQPKYLEGIKIR